MPYIKDHAKRKKINLVLEHLCKNIIDNCGDLNYAITVLIGFYINGELNYSKLNEVVGVLECSKHELYRRVISPYEDLKIKENGDLFPKNKE